MSDFIVINKKIKPFKKKILVSGDKSISIDGYYFLHYQVGFLLQKTY